MSINLGTNEQKLTPESMIVTETNEKGIIQYASKDFCKISGYTKEELVGQPHNMIRHEFMPKAAFADLWTTIQSNNKWVGIVINRTKDGGYYWVKAIVFPSKYVDGSTKYISVRVMPTQKEIDDVINLYPTMK